MLSAKCLAHSLISEGVDFFICLVLWRALSLSLPLTLNNSHSVFFFSPKGKWWEGSIFLFIFLRNGGGSPIYRCEHKLIFLSLLKSWPPTFFCISSYSGACVRGCAEPLPSLCHVDGMAGNVRDNTKKWRQWKETFIWLPLCKPGFQLKEPDLTLALVIRIFQFLVFLTHGPRTEEVLFFF